MTRTQILNFLAKEYNFQSYLEIGIGNNEWNFNYVEVTRKVGVDILPQVHATFTCSSDDFFNFNEESFDLIFIDGDHDCVQVDKDIENALGCLTVNGIIVCHDAYPEKEEYQTKPPSGVIWTGDVWKSIAKLRINRRDLFVGVLPIDYGYAIIRRGSQELYVPKIGDVYTWDYYKKHKKELMNVISIDNIVGRVSKI